MSLYIASNYLRNHILGFSPIAPMSPISCPGAWGPGFTARLVYIRVAVGARTDGEVGPARRAGHSVTLSLTVL